MDNFWPNGLELSDTQSPMEILESAQEDWTTGSNGVLALVLQKVESETGNDMIIVHAKHMPSKRTTTLFSVVHRPNTPYPATIQPKDPDLPNFLKKSYYKPGIADIGGAFAGVQGGNVTNNWVSDTPSEFRAKLTELFNLGIVKASMLNLASNAPAIEADNSEETTEKQTDEQ